MLEKTSKRSIKKSITKERYKFNLTFLQTQMSCNAEGKARGNKINKIRT